MLEIFRKFAYYSAISRVTYKSQRKHNGRYTISTTKDAYYCEVQKSHIWITTYSICHLDVVISCLQGKMIKNIVDIENKGALYSQNKLVMFVKIWKRKQFEEIFLLDQKAAANCLKSVILNSFSTEIAQHEWSVRWFQTCLKRAHLQSVLKAMFWNKTRKAKMFRFFLEHLGRPFGLTR